MLLIVKGRECLVLPASKTLGSDARRDYNPLHELVMDGRGGSCYCARLRLLSDVATRSVSKKGLYCVGVNGGRSRKRRRSPAVADDVSARTGGQVVTQCLYCRSSVQAELCNCKNCGAPLPALRLSPPARRTRFSGPTMRPTSGDRLGLGDFLPVVFGMPKFPAFPDFPDFPEFADVPDFPDLDQLFRRGVQ